MLRLFSAIATPEDISDRLVPMQKAVSGASWRPIENFHITLGFYGDVTKELAADLDLELANIQTTPFELTLKGAGWFGRREPHALWIGVAHSPALNELADRAIRAGKRMGIQMERRVYTPHVTLAYLNGTPLEVAKEWTERHQSFSSHSFWVDQFHLYSSHFGKGPSKYVAEADYPLL